MVQCNLLFNKRRHLDDNDMDFVMDPIPIGLDSQTGFPIYREITHSSIIHQPYVDAYKELNVLDDYGFFTDFLIRPGVRKFRQENVQLTVEQKGNDFNNPAFLIGFFGFRPGFYDAQTQGFLPAYDYYQMDRNASMMCRNTYQDLLAKGPSDVETLITQTLFAPNTIEELRGAIHLDENQENGRNGDFVAGVNSTFAYSGIRLPFNEIKQSDAVNIQNLFAGMNIVPGRYLISNWEEAGTGNPPLPYEQFTCDLDTSAYPQGWIRAVVGQVGQPDAFFFTAGKNAVLNLPQSQVTLHNVPLILGVSDGVWTVQAHPIQNGAVQLVGHVATETTFGRNDLRDAHRLELGISDLVFNFTKPDIMIYKTSPVRDFAYITAWQHNATVTQGNRVFTTHNLISPLFNHVIDSAAFPPGMALQAKLVIYVAIMKYEDSDTPSPSPILTLLPADDINSFSGTVNLI